MTRRMRMLAPLLSLLLVLSSAGGMAAASYPLAPSEAAIQDALSYLRGQQSGAGDIDGFAMSAWACIAIAAAGEDPDAWENGGPSLVDYLKAGPPGGDLSGEFNMGTFLSRMVLAAVAAGEDPSGFGSWSGSHAGVTISDGDYLGALMSLYDGTQFLQDLTGDPDSAETLNDDFWAVRALVSAGVSPYSSVVRNTVEHIMDYQEDDGGWTWGTPNHTWYSPDSSDVDSTAAALVALCLGGKAGTDAVSDGFDFVKSYQDASGGFISIWVGVNVQSTAWTVNAIGAAGQDPTGSAWTPVGANPIEYLLDTQLGDGSFEGMAWSTSEAIVALTGAYYRALAVPRQPVTVGGEALPIDRLGVLLPLLALGCLAPLAGMSGRKFLRFRRDTPC